jgi:flagellar biosynthetic protein FliR
VIEVLALSFALTLARAGTFVFFLPVVGGRSSPNTVKIGLTFALAVFWFTVWGTQPSAEFIQLAAGRNWLACTIAMGREALLGAILGFVFSMLMVPSRIAGAYVAQEMGLTIATISDPVTRQPASVLTHLFEALAVLVFFGLDVHHMLLLAMHASFKLWAVGAVVPDAALLLATSGVGEAHHWGLMIAAPIGISMFLTTVVLLLLNRASPQINLFSVGIVVRLGAGIAALLLFLPTMVASLHRFFARTTGSIEALFQL